MKPLFHRGYFCELFRQLRLPGIISAVILLLPNFSTVLTLIASRFGDETVQIPSVLAISLPIIFYVYIVGFLLTLLSYNWLNHRSTCDFYHALPIRRTQMYACTTLAIFLWMLIGVTATTVFQAILYLLTGLPFNYYALFIVYVHMVIGSLQIIGAVSLACALSGTRFVNFFASFFILFVPRFLCTMFAIMIEQNTSVLSLKDFSLLFNPSYNLFGMPYGILLEYGLEPQLHLNLDNLGAILYAFAHACLLIVLGGAAFHRRKSELAGLPMRSKVLQTAIRVAFGLPLLFVFVLILQNDAFSPAMAVLVIFSFTFYCLYELISTKSAKKMLKAMPLYSICIGIALLYWLLPGLLVKGALSIKADATNITGIQILSPDNYTSTYADIRTRNIVIDDPESIELAANAYARTLDNNDIYYGYQKKIVMHRSNGVSITRRVCFTPSELERLEEIAMHNDEYRAAMGFPQNVTYYAAEGLTDEEAAEIGNLYAQEYDALSMDDKLALDRLANTMYFVDSANYRSLFLLNVQGYVGIENYSQVYLITGLTPKAASRMAERMNEKYWNAYHDAITTLDTRLLAGEDVGTYWTMRIGSSLELRSFEAFFRADGKESFSKEDFPEGLEIVEILKNAAPTSDINEGVTIMIENMESMTDSENAYSGTRAYVNAALSDAELNRIAMLIELIYQRSAY